MADAVQRAIDRFANAAKWASIYELKVRLLADKTDELRRVALHPKLDTVEKAVMKHFEREITRTDTESLSAARGVRNKLLHCEFWTVEKRVSARGRRPKGAGLTLATFGKGSPLAALTAGKHVPLRELDKKSPRLFGWLLDSNRSDGLFECAESVIVEGIVVIERLLNLE